ncbi:unnamed protein product [Cyclocybe aegerita]|uniref:Uncharacterized protein n=1 Tax=Cyclocybe aegerita TaxID=1973307 RepID=A0A8S0W1I4_CYCAE|nr:unnamed protein product [Cyclocybe aegerita]
MSARNHDVIEMFHGWEKEFEDAVDNDNRLVFVARVVTHKVQPLLKEAKQDTALYNAIREYKGFILTLTKAWNHKTSVARFIRTAAAVIWRETLPQESSLVGPIESDLNPPPAAPLSPCAESPAAPEKPVNPPPTESIWSSSPPQPPRLDKGKEKIKPRPTFGKRTAKVKAASSKSTKKMQPAIDDSQYDAIEINSEEETAKAPTKRSNQAAKSKAKSRIKAEIKKTARKESDRDRDREANEDGDKVEDAPGPMLQCQWVAKPLPYILIPDAVPDLPSTGQLLDGLTNSVAAGAENACLKWQVHVLKDTIVNLLHTFSMEEPLISGKRTDANKDIMHTLLRVV